MKIVAAICAGIAGLAFTGWGIYQIKTGKMVAKNRAYPVDEPREVGILFLYIGILGIVLMLNLLFHSKSIELPAEIVKIMEKVCLGVGLFGTLLLVIIGIYDLIKKRVFSLKTTPKTRASIKKYYRPIGILSILAGIFIPAGIITLLYPIVNNIVTDVLFGVGIISAVILSILMCLIEASAKPNRK